MRLAAGAAAVALLSVVATAVPAEAHTTLTSSDPAKGATVASPRQIRLTYGDPVRFTRVVVEDSSGHHHESGKARTTGNKVTQAIAGVLTPGVYTVGWRVVAPDGHPATGEYTFTVKATGASPASSPGSSGSSAGSPAAAPSSAAPAAPATRPATRPDESGSSAGWWWIGLVVLVLALAGGGVALARRRG